MSKDRGRQWFIAVVRDRDRSVSFEEVNRQTGRALGIYLGTAVLGWLLYGAGVASYMNAEREYHGLAHFGAVTAEIKLATEVPRSER